MTAPNIQPKDWAWLFELCKDREIRIHVAPFSVSPYAKRGEPICGILDRIEYGGDRAWFIMETPGQYATEWAVVDLHHMLQIEVIRPVQEDETPASVGSPNTSQKCDECGRIEHSTVCTFASVIPGWFFMDTTSPKFTAGPAWHWSEGHPLSNSACGKVCYSAESYGPLLAEPKPNGDVCATCHDRYKLSQRKEQ